MTQKTTLGNSNRRTVLAALGAGGAVALAGCIGGDENGDDNDSGGDENDNNDDGIAEAEEPDIDTVALDPTEVPDPVDWDEPRHHEIELWTEEYTVEVEPGVTHDMMMFAGDVPGSSTDHGTIPGPMIRVREGDTIHLTFDVPEDLNVDVHNVDFHATYGPGGGAVDTTIAPGEGPVEIEFQTKYPGAHIYHCAPGSHDHHISTGMFGTILVEPEDGLPEVDREFYFGQHELYTDGDTGEEGHHRWDGGSAADENPTYVLFNGEVGRFTEDGEEGPLHAETGETVRLYWCNGGPNHVTSPHPIGNVFTRWWDHGDVVNEPMKYVEGATLGAGFVGFGDMDLPVPGPITLVDHSLSRVVRKGLLAQIAVEGEPNEDVYNPNP